MLERYATLFWDFDGVIKDSVEVKSAAFERLFAPFGAELARRVRLHHESNGGMSRYEKFPLYLRWACQETSEAEVSRYCNLFAAAVRQGVIDSPWVPGAPEYLRTNPRRQCFVLVTATPQAEIEDILAALNLGPCFQEVHGAPMSKSNAIESVLSRRQSSRAEALFIGDSDADYAAARAAGVEFLLRRTALNRNLQREHRGMQCEDFINE